jgi:phosphoadenosine phosphosulfate reductase
MMSTSTSTSLADQRLRQAEHDAAREEHHRERESLLAPIRSRDELKAIAAEASDRLADADTDEILAWVASEFGYRTAVACSMADAVLPDVVAGHLPWVDTLFLDTGYHFAETIGTRDAVESTMRLSIVDVTPRRSVEQQDAEFGPDLFSRDPGLCCEMRKVEPLAERLQGYEAWVTGVRREDSWLRADTPMVDWDAKNGMVKINPLAAWTFDQVVDYAAEHDVVVNPLMNDGYPSIGCAPCTRRVAPGEDPRAGRWAGLDKTECGLHT